MKRQIGDIVVRQLKRFADQIAAKLLIRFDLDTLNQAIHLRIGITPHVVIAVAAHAHRAMQGLQAVECVKGGHAPAEHVNAGFIALNHREIRHQRLGAQLGRHANLGPHCRDGLADALVVDVAVVGAGKVHFETVFVACLSQQFLGCIDAIGVSCVQGFGPAVDLGRNHRAGGGGHATHRDLMDRIDINGLVQRFTHAHVFEWVFALHIGAGQLGAELIHAQENRAGLGAVHDFQRRRFAQLRQILRARIKRKIYLAGEQSRAARGFGLDRGVDNLGHVGRCDLRVPAPPVGVFDQNQLLIRHPLFDHVRAGPHRIAVREALVFGANVFGFNRFIFLRPSLAHHAQLGELVDQDRIGALEMNIEGRAIDLFDAINTGNIGAKVRRLGHRALQRKHGIIHSKGAAVGKFDTLAQRDTHLLGIDQFPAGGQNRLRLEGLAVVIHQRFINGSMHAVGQSVVL